MLAPRKSLWSTPIEVIDKAIEQLNISSTDIVYDIGAGDGRFLIRCVETTSVLNCIGVEIDEERAMLAIKNIKDKGDSIEKRCKMVINNALNEDYSDGTAFFLYLVPRGLRLILQMLQNVANTKQIVLKCVTYMSPFPTTEGAKLIEINKISTSTHPDAKWPLYTYHITPNDN